MANMFTALAALAGFGLGLGLSACGESCPAGTNGCACTVGVSCDPGLQCFSGKCMGGGLTGGTLTGGTTDSTAGSDSAATTVSYDAGNGGDGGACMCAPKSDLIYVLAHSNLDSGALWTFDPETTAFAQVAPLNCPLGADYGVFSMGVSRGAKAWVQTYASGKLFTIDPTTGQCDPTGFNGGGIFGNFGMAFVSNSAADPCDHIYGIAGDWETQPYACSACGQLGRMNPNKTALEAVGPVDYFGGELTGTGDGRLFALVNSASAQVVELDKSTGAVKSTLNTGIDLGDGFAFAFWGGDLYIFGERDNTLPSFPEEPSRVYKVDWDGSDGNGQAVTTYVDSAPILVVGAGVSTCVPFTPPG